MIRIPIVRFLPTVASISLLLVLWSAGAQAIAQPELPAWRALEFERKAFWATAYSFIEVRQDTCDDQRWKLTANNSIYSAIVRNDETKELTLTPDDARLIQRKRYSGGSSQRFKFYDYLPQHISRERRDPGSVENQPPEDWPLSSRSRIAYPALPADAVITDAYALLLLATRFNASDEESLEVIVQTDFNFFRVRMTHSIDINVEASYQIENGKNVSGKRNASAVTMLVEPLGELAEESDFSLMGLSGRLILLFDKQNGVPIQLRGSAPRIGDSHIDLKRVVMRESVRDAQR